jgi:hypothetical protein
LPFKCNLQRYSAVSPGWEMCEVLANFEMCVYDLATDSVTPPCKGTVLRDSAAAGSRHMVGGMHSCRIQWFHSACKRLVW